MSVKKARTGSLIILTFQERVRANPCESPESHHCLPLYTSIRWLSAGKVLTHFFGLRKEILSVFEEELMESTNTFQAQLRSIEFLCDLAFLTDMTNHLNGLNLNLQGKGQSISRLVGHVEGFRSKLVLFTNCLQNNNPAQ